MATDFAVVKINSKQHLIEKNARLKVDRVSEDAVIEVLMAGIGDKVSFGEPILSGFGVKFEVISEGKDKKLIVRRFKNKSRYRKNKGHRQPITGLKVLDFGTDIKTELVWKEKEAEKSKESKETVEPKVKKSKESK
jgi:large subunit ribosomal protein L21